MKQVFYYLGDEQFQPEELVIQAVLAEQVGFDGVFISEHFNPWVADVSAAGFSLSTLGAIASKTSKLSLCTGVICPLFRYHPALVAQAAATIDRLSGGRFMLGVGMGEAINEKPLGFDFPDYQTRQEQMGEALQIIKSLLSGQKISFEGKFYTSKNTKLYSMPIHQIPILMAAAGLKSARFAAEHTDGIITSVKNPEESLQRVISPAIEQAGSKKLLKIASQWTFFASDRHEAYEVISPWRGLRAPGRDTATDPLLLQNQADALDKDDLLSKYTIISSPQDYIDVYKPLFEIDNADIVVIQTTALNQIKLIELLGEKVLPKLKE